MEAGVQYPICALAKEIARHLKYNVYGDKHMSSSQILRAHKQPLVQRPNRTSDNVLMALTFPSGAQCQASGTCLLRILAEQYSLQNMFLFYTSNQIRTLEEQYNFRIAKYIILF